MMGDTNVIRYMAQLERDIAKRVADNHPHYFREDDPAAWAACQTALLRAEALDAIADDRAKAA